jgi:polar amino acid transport system permease protein
VIGLSCSTAAYQAEILRGGFQSVPRGLIEAADMCGLTAAATFRRIRLPIAVRLTLPALTSEAIMILKSSSLISVVGVVELTTMAKDLASSTYRPLPIFAAAGFVYLVINLAVAGLGMLAERSARRGHA